MLAPWKESYDYLNTFLNIKEQRYYFANESPSSQSYSFSSSHVWMWQLDYKESWVSKNWSFWTVVQLVGSQFPNQGLTLGLHQWKCRVPTMGPPGNSLAYVVIFFYMSSSLCVHSDLIFSKILSWKDIIPSLQNIKMSLKEIKHIFQIHRARRWQSIMWIHLTKPITAPSDGSSSIKTTYM